VVTSILSLQKGLGKLGHSYSIFAPDSPGYTDKKGESIHRFHAVKFPPYPDYRAAIFPYAIPSSIAREEKLAVVHSKAMATMAIGAYKFAHRCHLPSVASVETMIPEGVHYISNSKFVQSAGREFSWAYLRWLYSHFDLVTAPSKNTQAKLLEQKISSVVAPSPIDTNRFSPDKKAGQRIRKKLGIGKEKMVLSVGRVVKEKNYDLLLAAAKQMKNDGVKFVVVGKGPYLERLKKNAVHDGVNSLFTFTGYVPDSDLAAYYNAADAFAFPSPFETQGLTLLEAFACGKPACALEGTPMDEFIRSGKNGFTFSDDPSDLKEKILACISKSRAMSTSSRKTALDYSIPNIAKNWVSIYKSLL
jgi:1,2-diacylglycerol 3-alpha-glucosyltransferase